MFSKNDKIIVTQSISWNMSVPIKLQSTQLLDCVWRSNFCLQVPKTCQGTSSFVRPSVLDRRGPAGWPTPAVAAADAAALTFAATLTPEEGMIH